MASPFKSIEELLKAALQAHLDPSKVDKILDNQGAIMASLSTMRSKQEAAFNAAAASDRVAAQSAQDLLAIKAFLGVPDPRIVATQDDVNKLGSLLKKQTDVANEFDRTIPASDPTDR